MIEVSPQWALLTGIFVSFFFSSAHSVSLVAKTWSPRVLQMSVILLGAALNFNHVVTQGAASVVQTFVSITLVFVLGIIGIKWLKVDRTQGLLITMGTAICGGSAIAALAPVIAADGVAVAVSVGIVFLLNAISVFVFPPLGTFLALTQEQFGTWSALAIHDTSAVVATASVYGVRALEVATTIKLTRALWIVPITMGFAAYYSRQGKKASLPWFILGFMLMSLAFTLSESLRVHKDSFLYLSKLGFALSLFLIGLTFSRERFRAMGLKPILFAIGIWGIVSIGTLVFVRSSL